MKLRRSIAATASIATVMFFFGGFSRTSGQAVSAKDQERILAFAEKFLIAVFKEDPTLKEMVGLPFVFYAPCKGGTATSFEDFEGLVLSRLGGVHEPPKTYDRRKVVTIERYVRSLPHEMFAKDKGEAEKEREAHIKSLGKDLHVAYLVHGKKDGDFAVAVLVRITEKRYRAVGIGGVVWEEANR